MSKFVAILCTSNYFTTSCPILLLLLPLYLYIYEQLLGFFMLLLLTTLLLFTICVCNICVAACLNYCVVCCCLLSVENMSGVKIGSTFTKKNNTDNYNNPTYKHLYIQDNIQHLTFFSYLPQFYLNFQVLLEKKIRKIYDTFFL